MARRSTRKNPYGRTKVGEHNGIDIFFSAYDKRFTASWRVYRGPLWAKSFDGLAKKLDRLNAKVFESKPQTVLVEDYHKGEDVYRAGKTTGRVKFEDALFRSGYSGMVEVEVKGKRSWYRVDETYLGDAKLALRLNRAADALRKAEKANEKLRKSLKILKVPRPAPPKKKVTTTTPGTNGGSITVTTVQ